MQHTDHDLRQVAPLFRIYGDLAGFGRYGCGHINDTYAATYNQAGTPVRYIHQRLNTEIFAHPAEVMRNIECVTRRQRQLLDAAGHTDRSRRALTLVPAADGSAYAVDHEGGYWRTYLFIEGARTHNAVTSPAQAFEAAKAFGMFQRDLLDFPAHELHETIPDFHNTPKRFGDFLDAVNLDRENRAASAMRDIDFAMAREDLANALTADITSGAVPVRVTHNDTKLNNVMLDDASGEGICVIDLDTVMPGSVLHDFGDLVRTCTCPTREDTTELSSVRVHPDLFEAVVRGYLAATHSFLTERERALLVLAGRLITFEIGLRFLTDHLTGDTYFKTARPNHNLERCRTQFALVQSLERSDRELNAILTKAVEMAGSTV